MRAPTALELKATWILALPIDEASAKVRSGPPLDDEDDYALPVWAGVLPLASKPRAPQPDPRMDRDVPLPASLSRYGRAARP